MRAINGFVFHRKQMIRNFRYFELRICIKEHFISLVAKSFFCAHFSHSIVASFQLECFNGNIGTCMRHDVSIKLSCSKELKLHAYPNERDSLSSESQYKFSKSNINSTIVHILISVCVLNILQDDDLYNLRCLNMSRYSSQSRNSYSNSLDIYLLFQTNHLFFVSAHTRIISKQRNTGEQKFDLLVNRKFKYSAILITWAENTKNCWYFDETIYRFIKIYLGIENITKYPLNAKKFHRT